MSSKRLNVHNGLGKMVFEPHGSFANKVTKGSNLVPFSFNVLAAKHLQSMIVQFFEPHKENDLAHLIVDEYTRNELIRHYQR